MEPVSTAPATPPAPRRTLQRDPAGGYVAGVCAGLAREVGIDPLIVRVGFIAGALAGGFGIAIYVLAWALLPAGTERGTGLTRSLRGDRASIEVALGAGLLLLSVLLTFREIGIWFSDAIVWPSVLIAAGGALIWRQTLGGGPSEAAAPSAGADRAEPAPAFAPRAGRPSASARARASGGRSRAGGRPSRRAPGSGCAPRARRSATARAALPTGRR